MAEARLRSLTLTIWVVLNIAAIGFIVVGISSNSDDVVGWILPVVFWAVAIGLISLLTVPAPSGTRLSLGIGAAVAASILIPEPAGLLSAVCLGLALAGVMERTIGSSNERTTGDFLTDAVAMLAYTAIALLIHDPVIDANIVDYTWSVVAVALVSGVVWFIIRAGVAAFVGLERSDLAGRYLWLLALEDWAVAVSVVAAGTLFGLTWPLMGAWAFAVSILPYAFGHLAMERYHSTKATYGQTIRALAQIPEVAGLAPSGHSERTGDLAVAIAQELGLHPTDVAELEYAALMHDVGRITLNEPAIVKAGFTDEDIARWGSQIIAEAPYLQHVSSLVALQHRPYRSPGTDADPDLPVASKIIKVASAYDAARNERGLGPVEALEQIHRGSAYDFDPKIAYSLRRVLIYRGEVPA